MRGHDHGANLSSKRRVASASRNHGELGADPPRFARARTAVAAALYRRAGWQHGERLDIARRLQPRVGSAALTCFSTSQLRHLNIEVPRLALLLRQKCGLVNLPATNRMRNGDLDNGELRRVIYAGMEISLRLGQ